MFPVPTDSVDPDGCAGIDDVDDDDNQEVATILTRKRPKDAANPELVDSLIAQKMSEMSVNDLNQAYQDIHAVVDENDEHRETAELLQTSLEQLDKEINLLNDKEAYLEAKSTNPDYVGNRDFQLAFLRADRFDVKKAALRLVRHFQAKLDLFGPQNLGMDITQDDLTNLDMEVLYSGSWRYLTLRDSAGRTILMTMSNPRHKSSESTTAKLRRMFYISMKAVQNPDTQKKGVVAIAYFFGAKQASNADFNWKLPKLCLALPIRFVAMHLCYDSNVWRPSHAILKASFNLFSQIRMRTHYGSHDQVLAILKGHGIQPAILPVGDGCVITERQLFISWLENTRQQERRTQSYRSRIFVPFRCDVLFGKGIPIQNHVGNVKFRALIADCQDLFDNAERGKKKVIAREIVETVQQSSGKFLRANDGGGGWIEVDDDAAHVKVLALFRTLRMEKRKKTKT